MFLQFFLAGLGVGGPKGDATPESIAENITEIANIALINVQMTFSDPE